MKRIYDVPIDYIVGQLKYGNFKIEVDYEEGEIVELYNGMGEFDKFIFSWKEFDALSDKKDKDLTDEERRKLKTYRDILTEDAEVIIDDGYDIYEVGEGLWEYASYEEL